MKLVVISSEDGFRSEISVVVEMFRNGLNHFHVRKPNFSESMIVEYLEMIPEEFHKKIVLHSFHHLILKYEIQGVHITKRHKKKWLKTFFKIKYYKLLRSNISVSSSCHSLSSLKRYCFFCDYVFLSPIFNSVSKSKKRVIFSLDRVKDKLKQNGRKNVYAFGGVDVSKVSKVRDLGFGGMVLFGSLWKRDNIELVDYFLKVKNCVDEPFLTK